MKKRLLGILLAVVMVFNLGIIPVSASEWRQNFPDWSDWWPNTPGGDDDDDDDKKPDSGAATTSMITFKIVNGTWKNLNLGSDATVSADGKTVTFKTTLWSTQKGYVYKCGGSMESMLNAILNNTGEGSKYIEPDEGYTLAGMSTQDWSIESGGLTGSSKNANQQMEEIRRNHHGYDDHKEPNNGFYANTVYVLTLTKANYTVKGTIDNGGTVTNSNQTLKYKDTSAAMVFTPASGYEITGVTVNGKSVSFTLAKDGTYTYPTQTIINDIAVVVTTTEIPMPTTLTVVKTFVGLTQAQINTLASRSNDRFEIEVDYQGDDDPDYDLVIVKKDLNDISPDGSPTGSDASLTWTYTWTLTDIPAGSYEIEEEADDCEVDGYTWTVTPLSPKHADDDDYYTTVQLDKGDNKSVSITNTYAAVTHTVSYDWGTEKIPSGVTLPTDSNTYVKGQSYTVDTVYYKNYTVETKDTYGNVNGVYTFSGWTDPNSGTMGDSNVTITGSWSFETKEVATHSVSYNWGTDNIPSGVTLPTDSNTYVKGQSYTVDTVYYKNYTVETKDTYGNVNGVYTFSGWTDPNSGTMGDSNVTITGSWSFETIKPNTWKVEYKWTNAPAGKYEQSLPDAEYNIVNSATHKVDTKYTSGYTVKTYDEYGNVNGVYTFSGWNKSGEITVTENITITGSWSFEKVDVAAHKVIYEWTNAPEGAKLPVDNNTYVKNQPYTVDETYKANVTKVEVKDTLGNVTDIYTFKGWNDPNNGTMGESDVTIKGTWEHTEVTVGTWKVEYQWTNAPEGKYAPKLPDPVYNLVNGSTHKVDTTYTSSTVIYLKDNYGNTIGKWTFSGWDHSGTIVVTGNVVIKGTWTYEKLADPGIPPIIPITPVVTEGSVVLTKVDDADRDTVLSGAVFKLYKVGTRDQYIGKYTTNAKGAITVHNLTAGKYYFVETRSPEGYVLDDSEYTFTVRAGEITRLTVTNEKAEVPEVFAGDHYAYIIGYDDGMVHPEASITRAEVATIFFRLLDDSVRNKYMTTENDFSDVNDGMWFNRAVSTMAAMGIVNGYPDGTFNPNGYITRAEFAAIAARFDAHGNTTDVSFDDIYEHWAKKEISIAANNGWVLGYEDGSFKPNQLINRAEAMTMVNRVLQRIPETKSDLHRNMIVWPDNMDTSKWYYLMVQEATNSHYYERKTNGYEYWTGLREVRDWTALEH